MLTRAFVRSLSLSIPSTARNPGGRLSEMAIPLMAFNLACNTQRILIFFTARSILWPRVALYFRVTAKFRGAGRTRSTRARCDALHQHVGWGCNPYVYGLNEGVMFSRTAHSAAVRQKQQ